jgi:ParB-like chromosome segregation protein Spo0J
MSENPDSLPHEVPDFLKRDRFHPMANMFPLLPAEELERLAKSIEEVGLLEPIVRYQGMILDGRNRFLALRKLGREPREGEDIFELGPDVDPFLYVVSKNIERRHLTAEQKREVVKALLAKYPDYSNRWIAELAKVSHHTVQAVKEEAAAATPEAKPEGTNNFAPKKKIGKDGKQRKPPEKKEKDPNAERKKIIQAFKYKWEELDAGQRKSFVRQYKPALETIISELDAE